MGWGTGPDAKVPSVSRGPKATESSVPSRSLGSVPPAAPCAPPPRTPRQWGGREAASGGLLSTAAARPRPPPGRQDPPSAPAGRGRGRVIFTSLQAAGATGSERAARQMWGARQLGAATAGLAAGRGRGRGGGAWGGGVCGGRIPGVGSPFVPRRPSLASEVPPHPHSPLLRVVASLSPICAPVPSVF